ncbi:hypothetical protein PSN_4276 [Pseudomonas sp. NGC7]
MLGCRSEAWRLSCSGACGGEREGSKGKGVQARRRCALQVGSWLPCCGATRLPELR